MAVAIDHLIDSMEGIAFMTAADGTILLNRAGFARGRFV